MGVEGHDELEGCRVGMASRKEIRRIRFIED